MFVSMPEENFFFLKEWTVWETAVPGRILVGLEFDNGQIDRETLPLPFVAVDQQDTSNHCKEYNTYE